VGRNIELKARISDPGHFADSLGRLNVESEQDLHQLDTFFRVPSGRLKLREFGDGTAELIHYHRSDRSEPKLSTYHRVAISDAVGARTVLAEALGVRGTVKKRRKVLLLGRTRIHVDQVEGLGYFVEFEVVLNEDDPLSVAEHTAADLLRTLGIPSDDLVAGAYIDLLEEYSMPEKAAKIPGPDHPIVIGRNPHRVVVTLAGKVIADTSDALILREAHYPAVQYIPRKDVDMAAVERSPTQTYCPYKGNASYFSIPAGGKRSVDAIWSYEIPYAAVAAIKDHLAFYPDRVDAIEERESGAR
jgi:predicted adenylyl cyclase CyaB